MYDPLRTEGDEVQTTEVTGSTVPRRQLGRYMRDLRGRARMTVRAAAQELEWSEGKIWRIETGQSSMRSHDAELMCRVYGADVETATALKALAKETRATGWWHSYGDVIPEFFDVYIGLEETASSFRWYEMDLVPGLLQTEAYARALIRGANPSLDDEEIERLVRVRTGRTGLLTRMTAPPTFQAVVGEAVLRCPVGGSAVMAAQLHRMLELGELEHIQLRVVPFAAGLHAGLHSRPFITLRFPVKLDGRDSEPPTVYVESFTGALYLDKPSELARYDAAWDELWQSALDEEGSAHLIRQAAREFER
ncbi:helix-turn-helix domain-containing protein [Kineosporia rhizophila]|uniref:helix-turn-helix domain-containing protein n=1 Tax=Kineosporia TaxID=49184 RepID=UPI001E616B60|nr:helix-turn-helix transcriptional regulator [Kineosporia sp. NBRC 101677]MCE0535856.1 helix-turn-helix domain-containing protein [Kineosporia rhizophila]GLY18160.1 transcriptional regulator [Kineosporia sp. NBRC 101677]